MGTFGGELKELNTGYSTRVDDDGRTYRGAQAKFDLPNEFYAFSLHIQKINGIIYIDVNEI